MIDSHFAPSFFFPPVVCTFAVGLWALIPCEVSAGACSWGYRAPSVSEPDSAAQASQGATRARPQATALERRGQSLSSREELAGSQLRCLPAVAPAPVRFAGGPVSW